MLAKSVVLVVCDGLRKDMVSPELTPAICGFAEGAHRFAAYRSLFTSTTRVVSASLATGCTPCHHGLVGNVMALEEPEGLVVCSAGEPEFRERLRRLTGRTLRRPTLAERISPMGESIVFSNVSPGAAYFQDPDGFGYVYHRAGSYGPGGLPVASHDHLAIEKGINGDADMTDRFCWEVLMERKPTYAVLWLSEPDHTGHYFPLGSPEHRHAITQVDRCVSQVLETVEATSSENTLIILCSDHGHETIEEMIPIEEILIQGGFKASLNSSDVAVAPNGGGALVYLDEESMFRCKAIESFLLDQDWVENIYTDEALDSIGQCPENGPAIAIDLKHSDKPNPFGIIGSCFVAADPMGDQTIGCGTHGGLGSYVQRPFLFIKGGGFEGGADMSIFSTPMDLAPTILHHLDSPCNSMDGQALLDVLDQKK